MFVLLLGAYELVLQHIQHFLCYFELVDLLVDVLRVNGESIIVFKFGFEEWVTRKVTEEL